MSRLINSDHEHPIECSDVAHLLLERQFTHGMLWLEQ